MKKFYWLCLFVIILVPCSFAQLLYDYQSLSLSLNLGTSMVIIPTTTNFYVSSADISLSWFPKDDYRQHTTFLSSVPSFVEIDDSLRFSFVNPSEKKLEVKVNSIVETTADYLKVKKKVFFPVVDFDSEFAPFLSEQEIIDINDDISGLANSLAVGSDDLFEVVFRFADWVERNIEYNLSSVTSDAAQKSSWVFNNRYGVCDELTSLFISLCRSVGIPARFISGISHTDVDYFAEKWGPHGWAEVYFPIVGWVPFDVTYRQFGWVDATHIKLQVSSDSTPSSVDFNAVGRGFNIKGGDFDSSVDVLSVGPLKELLVSLNFEVSERKVGFGSFNLLSVDLTNNQNHYLTVPLQLAPTTNIENYDDRFRNVLLSPGETKKEFFIVQVDFDLDKNYAYTFPLKLFIGNKTFLAFFKVDRNGNVFDFDYFNSQVPKQEAVYQPLQGSCVADKNSLYLGESLVVSCSFQNIDDDVLRWVNICLEQECHNKHFSLGETYDFEFTKNISVVGVKNLAVTLSNEDFQVSKYLLIYSLDEPLVSISDLKFPETISFKDLADVSFVVSQESFSNPKSVQVSIVHKQFSHSWNISDLSSKKVFSLSIPGRVLSSGVNKFSLITTFKDDFGKDYSLA